MNNIDRLVDEILQVMFDQVTASEKRFGTEAEAYVEIYKAFGEASDDLRETAIRIDGYWDVVCDKDGAKDPKTVLLHIQSEAINVAMSAMQLVALAMKANADHPLCVNKNGEALCPICDSPAASFFYDEDGIFFGCSNCITCKTASEVMG